MVMKFIYLGMWLRQYHLSFIARLIDYFIIRGFYSCDVQSNTKIGKDLDLSHNGLGVVIHPRSVIGDNVKILQGVTIGGRIGPQLPIIGNNVQIGAGAKILGGVRIGNNARIGANAVVLIDIPDGCTAVGVPAKIISSKNNE